MRVTVQLFARLRELAGCSRCEIQVPDSSSVEDVWRALAERHPALGPFAGAVSCAVNTDFARMQTTVLDGDEVAFLPPVSGGSC
jgi:molybdopterin converting factor subunit 1